MRDRILPFLDGSGEIVFGSIAVPFERLGIPPELVRLNEGTFVVTYTTRQLDVGAIKEGSRASYRIVRFLGGGRSAETYKAEVIAVKEKAADLHVGDSVVITLPLFLPYLVDAEINDLTSRLETLLIKEEVGLQRVADLRSVAALVDIGYHRFPKDGTATTKFIVQEFVDGDALGKHLSKEYANPATGTFTGLPGDEFYRLARVLAEAVLELHCRVVIHGDIWPESIMMRRSREPVFINFGQAAFREAAEPIAKVSGRHARYLWSEETRSIAGDVYSLGGVLFYLATGEDPPAPVQDFNLASAAILERIRACNEQLYRDTRGVADIIAHCVCFPDRRYRDVRTVVERLDTFFVKPDDTGGADLRAALTEASTVGGELKEQGSELFRRFAVVRARGLREDLRAMSRGVFDIAGDPEAIAASLTQYLAFLGQDDEYLAVSTPGGWRPENPGINGEFLSMNIMAAGRGATIKRLLVIAPDDLDNVHLAQIMESQVQALREVRAVAPEANYEVKVLFVETEAHEELLKNHHHFGLLIKQGDVVGIFPEFREDGSVVAVRFRAGHHLVGDLNGVFSHYWRHPDAIVLRHWPATEEITARAYAKFLERGQDGFDLVDFVQSRRELIEGASR